MASLEQPEYRNCSCTENKPKHIPWYKERLRTFYIKNRDPAKPSQFFDTKGWTFVKDGMDDFRDGFPASSDQCIIPPRQRGIGPLVKGSPQHSSSVKEDVNKNRFSEQQTCFSKTLPLDDKKKEYVKGIEEGLLNHPLALYSHYANAVPPEVFEELVDLVDPELAGPLEEAVDINEESSASCSPTLTAEQGPLRSIDDDKPATDVTEEERNPYQWVPKKDEVNNNEDFTAPQEDEHMAKVTAEFCKWMRDLGGSDLHNIEEATVQSLFASGYETKPALSVPIHVVDVSAIPPELRQFATSKPRRPSKARKNIAESNIPAPSKAEEFRKFRYGAWYLPKSLWKKTDASEELQHPEEEKLTGASDLAVKSQALDAELAEMHGPKAFIDFISSKEHRLPQFVKKVAEMQKKDESQE